MMSCESRVQPLLEANSSSTDPSIPPGFETYNRFHEIEDENEVVSAPLVKEDSKISISKRNSTAPSLGCITNSSLKSKATVLFPNGTLSSKKKGISKSLDDPHKISAVKLLDAGSLWGLSFPSSKNGQKEMFSDLRKNHKELTLEEVDKSTT